MDARLDVLVYDESKSYGYTARVLMREFPTCGLSLTKNSIAGHIHQRRVRLHKKTAPNTPLPPPRVKDRVNYRIERFQPHALKPVGHPFVAILFKEMNVQQCSYRMMGERSGVNKFTLSNWRTHCPKVSDLEACFNVLGMSMYPMINKFLNGGRPAKDNGND